MLRADEWPTEGEHFETFSNRYTHNVNEVIRGGQALVYKAWDNYLKRNVALKVYTDNATTYNLFREIQQCIQLNHRNLLSYYDVRVVYFHNHPELSGAHPVGILEWANAGNLIDYVRKPFSEEEFRKLIIDILNGLIYLHGEANIIHRDLSPDNIFIAEESGQCVPKIADFGISKEVNQQTQGVTVGKIEYMAPELLDEHKFGEVSHRADLWSFGIMIEQLFHPELKTLFRRNVGERANIPRILHHITNKPVPSFQLPVPYQRMVEQCLVKPVSKRVDSAEALKKILQPETKITTLRLTLVASVFLLFTGVTIGLIEVLPFENSPSGDHQVVEPVRINVDEAVNTIAASLQFGYHEKDLVSEVIPPEKITRVIKTASALKKTTDKKNLNAPTLSHALVLKKVNNLFQKIATPGYPAKTGTDQVIGKYFTSDSIPVFTDDQAESSLLLQSFIQKVKEEASFSSLAGFWIVNKRATHFSSSGKIIRLGVTRKPNPVSLQVVE